MVQDKNSALNRGRLLKAFNCEVEVVVERPLKAFNCEVEVVVERPHSAPSRLKAISQSIDELMKERERLTATITELEARLAVSEELVGQLRKELARKDGRSSGKEDPSGVKRLVRPSDGQ